MKPPANPGIIDRARVEPLAELGVMFLLFLIEVTPEAVEASLQLGARVLEGLGVSGDAIARRLDDMRDEEFARISVGKGEKSGRS